MNTCWNNAQLRNPGLWKSCVWTLSQHSNSISTHYIHVVCMNRLCVYVHTGTVICKSWIVFPINIIFAFPSKFLWVWYLYVTPIFTNCFCISRSKRAYAMQVTLCDNNISKCLVERHMVLIVVCGVSWKMECLWQLIGLVAFFFRTNYVGWLFYLNADSGVYLESFVIAIMHLQTIKVFLKDHDISSSMLTTKGGLVKGSNAHCGNFWSYFFKKLIGSCLSVSSAWMTRWWDSSRSKNAS